MVEAHLETRDLGKDFGGLHAVRDLNFRVTRGGIHAVIGPNGAGKSTLVGLLAGALRPSAGRILFEGRDVTGSAPHRMARLGVGRGFQRTSIFPELTVLENVWLGARRTGHGEDGARAALALCGLELRVGLIAGHLSHGERKELEVAVMLAAEPALLLLDEPLAGMGAEESERMGRLLKSLSGGRTLVLVEHDMDMVFRLADTVTVMVDGRMLASGTPDAIRSDERVREAYLGHGGANG